MNRAPTIWLFLAGILLGVPAAHAHDVKDPVCRMMTDTDTTPFQETAGGRTYFFCSEGCRAQFDKAPAAYIARLARLAGAYRLDLEAPPHPAPRRPVPLVLTVRAVPSGRVVREFETVHERRLHLLLVRADLGWFEHQHPAQGPDGRFRLAWTFPRAGRYFLFADCTPVDGDNQILRAVLDIGGPVRAALPRLTPDMARIKTAGGTRVRLAVRPGSVRAGHQAVLTYTLTDGAGRPRTDMQPILGVMGHLIAVREDWRTLVHTHALHGVGAGSYSASLLALRQAGQNEPIPVTPAMVTPTGPCFTFKLTLPLPGRYRVWAQFQRKNRWLTVPFTVSADSGSVRRGAGQDHGKGRRRGR